MGLVVMKKISRTEVRRYLKTFWFFNIMDDDDLESYVTDLRSMINGQKLQARSAIDSGRNIKNKKASLQGAV